MTHVLYGPAREHGLPHRPGRGWSHRLVVLRGKKEPVVILPLAEVDSLRETLHLLSNAANAERLLASIAELDASEVRRGD